jgi:4-hydroxy-tetrahydrodipicolinate reductase
MNIALLGYGKMGKIIDQIATGRKHHIVARITSEDSSKLETLQADVAIEFSKPEAAYENVASCIRNGIPVVCGTTGWLNRMPEIEKLIKECNGTFFYASNFSVGVNIFFRLNEYLAKMTQSLGQFEVSIDEIHHTEKKDAPSGTAITLAQGIMKHHTNKKRWVNHESENPEDLFIHSFRIDQVPGTHTVKYDSLIDSIEMRHVAHSREGFAKGAVMVAEWLPGKKGMLSMDDFLTI